MKTSKIFILTIIFVIAILASVKLIISNTFSTSGVELSKINAKIQEYNKQNSTLKEKMFTETSLTQIASRASSLGFVSQKDRVYISNPLPLAAR